MKLRPVIEQFPHYNFNFYSGEIGVDHISIRVRGMGKKEFEKKINKLLLSGLEFLVLQPYKYKGKKAYEAASKCTFMVWKNKKYYTNVDMKEFIHGIFDNFGWPDKAEGMLHLKMAWHFLVKKPFYLKMRKIKKKLKSLYDIIAEIAKGYNRNAD